VSKKDEDALLDRLILDLGVWDAMIDGLSKDKVLEDVYSTRKELADLDPYFIGYEEPDALGDIPEIEWKISKEGLYKRN